MHREDNPFLATPESPPPPPKRSTALLVEAEKMAETPTPARQTPSERELYSRSVMLDERESRLAARERQVAEAGRFIPKPHNWCVCVRSCDRGHRKPQWSGSERPWTVSA
jgi:hypothetical protein